MSHDALKRLGVFSVGDKVVYMPDNPFDEDENATVVTIGTIAAGRVEICVDDPKKNYRRQATIWVSKDHLKHRADLMRTGTKS